jgi:hypothetical protein
VPVDDAGESHREEERRDVAGGMLEVSEVEVDGTGGGSVRGSGGSRRRQREKGDLDETLEEAGFDEETRLVTEFFTLGFFTTGEVARTRGADTGDTEVDHLVVLGRDEEASANLRTVGNTLDDGWNGKKRVSEEEREGRGK